MTRHLLGSLPVLALVSSSLAQTTTTRYEVVELGLTENASELCACFFVNAINDDGDAAGFFFGNDGSYNAFAHRDGVMTDVSPPGENLAFGRGMNDLGWVVGWTDFFAPQHAFLHDGTQLIDLGTLGGTYSDAHDVNDAGRVVGCAGTPLPDDDQHAAVWENGEWTDLGTLGGAFSEALAVNEAGLIVGWSWNEAWDRRPVYWTPDLEGPFELPTFSHPERHALANGVNDAGVIVGQVEVDPVDGIPTWRAARWADGAVVDLGLLRETGEGSNIYGLTPHTSTAARAINGAGAIVGMSTPASDEPLRPGPFVHEHGTMTNLNDLLMTGSGAPWVISDVASINDSGVIGATARTLDDTHAHAVLLVPVEVLVGDVDRDGAVGFADLLALLAAYGPCSGCTADLDLDGAVTFTDLLMLLGNWG